MAQVSYGKYIDNGHARSTLGLISTAVLKSFQLFRSVLVPLNRDSSTHFSHEIGTGVQIFDLMYMSSASPYKRDCPWIRMNKNGTA